MGQPRGQRRVRGFSGALGTPAYSAGDREAGAYLDSWFGRCVCSGSSHALGFLSCARSLHALSPLLPTFFLLYYYCSFSASSHFFHRLQLLYFLPIPCPTFCPPQLSGGSLRVLRALLCSFFLSPHLPSSFLSFFLPYSDPFPPPHLFAPRDPELRTDPACP